MAGCCYIYSVKDIFSFKETFTLFSETPYSFLSLLLVHYYRIICKNPIDAYKNSSTKREEAGMKTPAQKRKEKKKSHIPFRLNFLFFIVFLLFASLILRLAYLQIIRADDYRAEVERTESTVITGSVPRGEIFDANLRRLVGNEARNTITYTRGQSTTAETMAEVAYNLAAFIDMPNVTEFENSDDSDLSERDLKDYFYATHNDLMEERIESYVEETGIDPDELSYGDQLELISEEEITDFTEREKTAAAIFTNMNSAYSLSTVNIKNEDVSQEEIARVSENLDLLPGVGTGTDWVRTYPEGDMMRSILGNVSTEEQGIPESERDSYLARGYSRNDRVGRSFIELQYEDVLRGSQSRSETETNSRGDIINQVEQYAGSKGDNLILTTDIEFQETVDQIARDSLAQREGLNDSIYIAALDPRNGDVLALSGQRVNSDGEIEDHTLGVLSQSFEMGSSVKGASVLAGYHYDVIDTNDNVFTDQPMSFQGSQSISSVFNRSGSVAVNDITALERSSNVYMARLAMSMGGVEYYNNNMSLPLDTQQVLTMQRDFFNQFGLGTNTGIDLPSESTGQIGSAQEPGNALFFSFGQFDTYTTLQLAQYVSTIANDGVRIAPRLVSEIRGTDPDTGGVGALKTEIEPKIMNTVDVSEEEMNRVQQGFYQVVNGSQGTARNHLGDAPYSNAGKTGTAQAQYWGEDESLRGTAVTNITYVGYAPYENPEIAVAVVVPYLPQTNRSNQENMRAARRVFDAYFEVGEFEPSEDQNTGDEETIEELEGQNEEAEEENEEND